MRTMIDLGSQRGTSLYIIDTATAVDCTKDVRFGRRSFRSLIECVVPCCAGFPISSNASAFGPFGDSDSDNNSTATAVTFPAPTVATATTVTGTFFGHRRGRVRFCVHDHPAATAAPPLLLLEFTVSTAYLAREMQHGLLRVALEGAGRDRGPLLGTPVWTMYCNGRKVGFAIRRRATEADAEVFRLMRSVSAGTGILPSATAASGEAGDLLYMRARFERVIGSTDSESFHMIDPAGGRGGQQLSIFLIRT